LLDTVTSTTLTSAGPLFNRNYFGVFTDQFIENNSKQYFQIEPKEVVQRGMKLKYFSPEMMGTLEILDIVDAKGKALDKATCNT
jgi:hypothetical protein